jgi:curved DNA-binding protein
MADQDLYQVLGVDSKASDRDIKAAYRRLARKYHPDVNPGDNQAEERFKSMSAAFEVLSDPEKRKMYDELGPDAEKLNFDPEKAREYRRWRQQADQTGGPFRYQEGGASGVPFDLGDLFGDLFGGGRGGAGKGPFGRGPMAGQDVQASLSIGFAEAIRGGERTLQLSAPGSAGARRINVRVPPGVRDGQKIRLAGQGAPGLQGGASGDLYITIAVTPHALWRRQGQDLEFTLPVTVPEALLGAEVSIPTLSGTVTLKVPAGAQTGLRLRIRGKGVPGRGKEPAGDLYAEVSIRLPEDVAAGEGVVKEVAEQLRPLYRSDVRASLSRLAGD